MAISSGTMETASRSMVDRFNGANNGTRRRSSSLPSGTSDSVSRRLIQGQVATAMIGSSAPVSASVPRIPTRSSRSEATMPPRATARPAPPSRSPNAARRSRGGKLRWRIVNPAMSSDALLKPVTTIAPMATIATGQAPITAIGRPHRASDTANTRESRTCPPRLAAPTAPIRPPRPMAALSQPMPASPRSSSSSEATTMRAWLASRSHWAASSPRSCSTASGSAGRWR